MFVFFSPPRVLNQGIYSQYYDRAGGVNLVIAGMANDGLVTVDSGGCVRLWETALFNLDKSLKQWRKMIGDGEDKPLEV